MTLTREQKKAMRNQYNKLQKQKYVLDRTEAEELFAYLEACIDENGCDHTLRYAEKWLDDHLDEERIPLVLEELEEMGGFCDCEIILNCYEDYDLV